MELVRSKGAATLATMPYDHADYLTQPSATAMDEAKNFLGGEAKTIVSVQQYKAALAHRVPFVLGMPVYPSFIRPLRKQFRVQRLVRRVDWQTCRGGRGLRRRPIRRRLQGAELLGNRLGRRGFLLDSLRHLPPPQLLSLRHHHRGSRERRSFATGCALLGETAGRPTSNCPT